MASVNRLPVYFAYADFYLAAALQRLTGPGTHYRSNGEFAIIRSLLRRYADVGGEQPFCFVDAGAERGVHSSYVLEICKAIGLNDVKILAIEPLPQYAMQLRDRLGGDLATVVEAALGSKSAKSTYYYEKDDKGIAGSRSLYSHLGSVEQAITVEVLELDQLVCLQSISKINFLKVDVEGGELEALEGAQALLSSGSIDYIQLEYSHLWLAAGASLSRLMVMIASWDYDLYQIYPASLRSVPSWHPALDDFQLKNYLLVRKGMPLPLPCHRKALPFLEIPL
jgi:FkbM family methyltransferase